MKRGDGELNTNLNLTLLALGFRTGNFYHTFDASVKVNQNAVLPKSLFNFVKVGTANGATSWQIENVGFGADAFGEIAYGLSTTIGESLHIGARLKVLMGLAHAEMMIDKLDLSLTGEKWAASTEGVVEIAGPISTGTSSADNVDLSNVGIDEFNGLGGFGFGVDLGASYEFLDYFTASASLLDLGFISWKDMTKASSTGANSYEFNGFGTISDGSELQ